MRKVFVIAGIVGAVFVAALIVANLCMFVVHERDQVVVTRLNKPVHVIVGDRPPEVFDQVKQDILNVARRDADSIDLRVSMGAGLYFKMPFADTVERFPDVLMTYDAEPESVVLADKKTLVVDNFARWRIENPLLFRISVQSVTAANGRLDDVIYSAVREELGKNNLTEVIRSTNDYVADAVPQAEEGDPEALESENTMRERISLGREKIMEAVMKRANDRAREQFGIRVVDVSIKRADLLEENFQAVYGRMSAERSRISKGYRSEGSKQADIIMGNTDLQVQVLLANAEREAAELRGQADAEAIGIFAETFNSNPKLYTFMRSLEVLEESMQPGTEAIVSADSGLFRLLKDYKP
ncbi:MAG: protease modulator HflC [Candidatus Hydrogenedentes bacterium]|nr:protease modulator HflC [Candidatus Hydrogenedentota bacterium]